ncbi:MAG TPA: ABC-three component system middle component 6 [Candidatus Paceibacterota bacterium]|nr:ABC-three component system middle component 6 [Candidatus Paceibacterota bacterium]
MLLPDNLRPENSIYYIGSLVLEEMYRLPSQNISDLYIEMRTSQGLTFPAFVLALDWLFLLDVVKMEIDGRISIVS